MFDGRSFLEHSDLLMKYVVGKKSQKLINDCNAVTASQHQSETAHLLSVDMLLSPPSSSKKVVSLVVKKNVCRTYSKRVSPNISSSSSLNC